MLKPIGAVNGVDTINASVAAIVCRSLYPVMADVAGVSAVDGDVEGGWRIKESVMRKFKKNKKKKNRKKFATTCGRHCSVYQK